MGTLDLFSPRAAIKICGNAVRMYAFKLSLLIAFTLPLVLGDNMTEHRGKHRLLCSCEIEYSLALRASNVGGLGRSKVYEPLAPEISHVPEEVHDIRDPSPISSLVTFRRSIAKPSQDPSTASTRGSGCAVLGYELLRLGYVVYGDRYLITFADWITLLLMRPLRFAEKLWNQRIAVFDNSKEDGVARASRTLRMCRIEDPELKNIAMYDLTMCSFP